METTFNGANTRLPIYPLRVFRIDPGTTHHLRTLSLMYGGLFTHYVKGSSRYCAGDECRPEYHRCDRIWKGYASVEVYGQKEKKWFPVVLEMTEGLEQDFRGVYTRGQVWEVWREPQPTRKATPVKGKLLEERDEKTFPEAFDYLPVLKHLYHCERIDIGAVNPLPPRVIVSPSDGAPPAVLIGKEKIVPTNDEHVAKELAKRINGTRMSPTEKSRN